MKYFSLTLFAIMFGFIQFISAQSNDDVVNGLKDALNVGTNNSVLKANKKDGYFKDARLTIPFPPDAENIKKTVKSLPRGGRLVDTLELKLNRAAENAAVKAKPIFVDAILHMTFDDGMKILTGGDHAATDYLKAQTYAKLVITFKPDIQNSLAAVHADKAWTEVTTAYNSVNLFGKKKINTDLAQYTTQKALDGLFILIADEETKIRKDPAARVTDILKSVFGKL